jgi:hypothetical protein
MKEAHLQLQSPGNVTISVRSLANDSASIDGVTRLPSAFCTWSLLRRTAKPVGHTHYRLPRPVTFCWL